MTNATLIEKLKSCPFCGGDAKIHLDTSSDYPRQWTYGVVCSDQKCPCDFGYYKTETEALQSWNRRASFPLTPSDRERLVEVMAYKIEEAALEYANRNKVIAGSYVFTKTMSNAAMDALLTLANVTMKRGE